MGKKTPKAPSPAAQAAAQGAVDKETAYYNAQLANTDQITPYGNLTYQNLGTKDAPKYQATTTLSPEQQKILDSQNRQDIALNQLGEGQIGRITDAVSTPFSYGGIKNALPTYSSLDELNTKYTDALMSRLNPRFQQDEEALRTRLINQGIGQGSEAYRREMETFNQSKNDANIQAILAAQQYGTADMNNLLGLRNQEISEYTTQRNAPLNEFTALTSGTQIQNPNVAVNTSNSGIQPFNMAGAMRDQYSNQQAAANNRMGATSNLFGLGGGAVGTYFGGPVGGKIGSFVGSGVGSLFGSDRRIKENIVADGFESGHRMYQFNYIGQPEKRYRGVMAQDVIETHPDAVINDNGVLKVDYAKLGVEMTEVA